MTKWPTSTLAHLGEDKDNTPEKEEMGTVFNLYCHRQNDVNMQSVLTLLRLFSLLKGERETEKEREGGREGDRQTDR